MRHIKTLLLALLFTILMPLSQAAAGDTTMVYTQEQVDSIVAKEVQKAVKAEVARQVDGELIDLKIDKIANDKYANKQTAHDSWILTIVTIMFAVVGIMIPLLLKRWNEERLKIMLGQYQEKLKGVEDEINNDAIKIQAKIEAAEKSAQESNFNVDVMEIWTRKEFTSQLGVASQLVRKHPNDTYTSRAYYFRGYIYSINGDHEKAIEDFTEALKLNADDTEAYYHRGFAFLMQDSHEAAKKDFSEAIRNNANYENAYIMRGITYGIMGNYDKEINDCTEAIRIMPNDTDAYYLRGYAYEKMGDEVNAERDRAKAKEKIINHAETKNNWANCMIYQKDYQRAILLVDEAIQLEPDVSYFYITRCRANMKLKQWEDALADANKGLEIARKWAESDIIKFLDKKKKRIEEEIEKQKNNNEQQN